MAPATDKNDGVVGHGNDNLRDASEVSGASDNQA